MYDSTYIMFRINQFIVPENRIVFPRIRGRKGNEEFSVTHGETVPDMDCTNA